MAELARIVLHRGRDPFTPPHTKVVWVKSSIPGVKVPVIKYKWMNSEVSVIVTGPDEAGLKEVAEDCLRQAAIKSALSALVAGYASGGSAAVSAAVATFTATIDSCMEAKLKQELNISAEIASNSHWDADWS